VEKTAFELQALSVFHDLGYSFYQDFQQGEALKRMPTGQKAVLFAGMLAAGGLVAALGTGSSKFTDEEVKQEVEKLAPLCDLIGIRSSGGVSLALFVHANDLADESLVGKCHLIQARLSPFKTFAMRFGWSKYPVFADVFFVFSNSEKAFHFRQCTQDHCKQFEFFKKTHVLPWGIDTSAKSVWGYKGLPLLAARAIKPTDLEAKLFSE
jgi:hypothetical protein